MCPVKEGGCQWAVPDASSEICHSPPPPIQWITDRTPPPDRRSLHKYGPKVWLSTPTRIPGNVRIWPIRQKNNKIWDTLSYILNHPPCPGGCSPKTIYLCKQINWHGVLLQTNSKHAKFHRDLGFLVPLPSGLRKLGTYSTKTCTKNMACERKQPQISFQHDTSLRLNRHPLYIHTYNDLRQPLSILSKHTNAPTSVNSDMSRAKPFHVEQFLFRKCLSTQQ